MVAAAVQRRVGASRLMEAFTLSYNPFCFDVAVYHSIWIKYGSRYVSIKGREQHNTVHYFVLNACSNIVTFLLLAFILPTLIKPDNKAATINEKHNTCTVHLEILSSLHEF